MSLKSAEKQADIPAQAQPPGYYSNPIGGNAEPAKAMDLAQARACEAMAAKLASGQRIKGRDR